MRIYIIGGVPLAGYFPLSFLLHGYVFPLILWCDGADPCHIFNTLRMEHVTEENYLSQIST